MQILSEKIISTVDSNNAINCLDRIINSVKELCREIKISTDDLEGIGFGILGPVINNKDVVPVRGFHWEGKVNLEKEVNKHINLTVFAENDVNVISFGEYMIRKNEKTKNIVTIAIGTGVGVGIVIDGKIYSGKDGTAGEICACGGRACVSLYCGGKNFKKSFLNELRGVGKSEYYEHSFVNITVKDIFDAAKDGEKIALKHVNEFSECLAKEIINMNNLLNPDLIVIAGGVSLSGNFLLSKIKERISETGTLESWMLKPNVELSVLGNQAGILGAALMARSYLNENQ